LISAQDSVAAEPESVVLQAELIVWAVPPEL